MNIRVLHPLKKTLKFIFLLIIIDIMLSAAWAFYILKRTGDFEKQNHFQVVVILMGDFNHDYSALGSETLKRLNFALSLRDKLYIENYLCVGGSRPTENIFGAELMKDYLQKNGVPAKQIYSDGRSFDTKGNWQDALKLIEQKNWKTVGMISSAFHLYRAKQFIIKPSKNVNISFIPFPYITSYPKTTLLDLWRSIHYEWVAYILYALPASIYNSVLLLDRPQ